MIGRVLCALGLHDSGSPRRLGFVTFALCRRPGCARYSVRKGWTR